MLGYAYPCARNYKRRRSRNVESAASIAASAAGVHQGAASSSADVKSVIWAQVKRGCGSADGFRETNDLFDRFALHVQRDQQRSNLSVCALARQPLRHNHTRLFTRERLAVISNAMERVNNRYRHHRGDQSSIVEARPRAKRYLRNESEMTSLLMRAFAQCAGVL